MSNFRTTVASARRYLRNLVRPGGGTATRNAADEFSDIRHGTVSTRHEDGSVAIDDPEWDRREREKEAEMDAQFTFQPRPAAPAAANKPKPTTTTTKRKK